MKITFPFSKVLALAVIGSSAFTFSCSDDDDKPSCTKTYTKLLDAYEEMMDEDCEVQVQGYEKVIDIISDGKNCEAIKGAAEDAGYDSVEEYIDALEEEKDEIEDDCNAPS